MSIVQKELDILRYWILERERIRIRKSLDQPKPWTKDPILRDYRFCNVHREDDKVTLWIAHNWRDPNNEHPNLYIAMILARLINWPPALEDIGFPNKWDHKYYLNRLRARKSRGEQIWTGAYMVTAGGKARPKEEAVVDMVHDFYRAKYRPHPGDTLLSCWEGLQAQGVLGMGSFLSAQVVADLKYTPLLATAPDWMTFCAPGPGSQAGLNILLGLPLTKQWNRQDFEDWVNHVRELVVPTIHAQDMQNCFCEFSKYRRGFSRSRYQGV